MGTVATSGARRQRPQPAVGRSLPRLEGAHGHHPRLERHGGAQPFALRLRLEGRVHRRSRQVPVEADATPHHGVAGAGKRHRAGGVGRVQHRCGDACGGQVRDQAIEEIELPFGEGAVLRLLAVGHGQMRPHALEVQHGLAHDRRRERHEVLGSRPDPVHAGVHLHVDRHGPARRPRRRREGRDPLGGVQRRGEPVRQRGVDGIGSALAQQQHRRRHAVLAQLHSFVDQRDGEPLRAPGQRGPAPPPAPRARSRGP